MGLAEERELTPGPATSYSHCTCLIPLPATNPNPMSSHHHCLHWVAKETETHKVKSYKVMMSGTKAKLGVYSSKLPHSLCMLLRIKCSSIYLDLHVGDLLPQHYYEWSVLLLSSLASLGDKIQCHHLKHLAPHVPSLLPPLGLSRSWKEPRSCSSQHPQT